MHGQLKDILDDVINEVIGKDQVQLIFEGAIARTYLLQGADGRRRFLKIQDINSCEPLEIQKQRLEWLKDKLSVPRVLYYEKIKDKEYMITAEVPGYDGASSSCKAALPDVIVAIAEGLRVIHSISTVACPYDNSLEKQLVIAEKNFHGGKVDSEELLDKFGNGDVKKSYEELLKLSKEVNEELVFTHGDFSMPNVILKDGKLSGFLDLGSCGLADPYADLAIAEKSIIRNYGHEYVNSFYSAYGIDKPDEKKVKLYQLLECFIYV